jgi:sugar phosphate isomerase/epimerase
MSWRFAVSTLGMPGVPVREAAQVATEHGCHGLEIRVHPDEEVHLGLAGSEADRVRGRIADAGLVVACLAGYPKVCAPGPDEPVVAELRALIELAGRLGAPAVRVFPGGDTPRGDTPRGDTPGGDSASGDGGDSGDGVAHDRIGAVLDDLRDSGVQLLVETHDSHPTGEAALRLVEPFAAPKQVAVLWDALHPWRHGEAPARTRAVLGEYLAYFQIKDAEGPHNRTPLPPGQGGVPLAECGELLRTWSGWISLEWEKAWYPEIAPVTVPLRAAAAWFTQWDPGGP